MQKMNLMKFLADIEEGVIRSYLRYTDYNIAKAAVLLTIGRTTLSEKAKKLQIKRPKIDKNRRETE